ncbi:hypothetical protein F5Y10DRAFT_242969 [Nemania abortiva]|nr:hypothetical protein F5Y10DRAFT_242969 [Nemania abortiva]
MLLPTLFLLCSSVSVGHALYARAGQQLTNPDNEPDYRDPVTGNTIPKSRVLSGVGPQAADNRWFDWDESCSDADQRTKIANTFDHSLQLTMFMSQHLDQLQMKLPTPPGTGLNQANKKFIFQTDPAYAQMFKGLDHKINYVKETFDLVNTRAQSPPATRGGGGPSALRFICNADDKVMNQDNTQPYCGTTVHALTAPPHSVGDPGHIEPKYRFETATSITFCPAFFADDQFPNIDAVVGSGKHTLDQVECAERVLIHEYMHVPWIRDMPGIPDYTGYYNAANYAKRYPWNAFSANPDNYAWLVLYAYFNNNNVGCGADVWPQGQDKPNKG